MIGMYLTPTVADFSDAEVARWKHRCDCPVLAIANATLEGNVFSTAAGSRGEISYAGAGAETRARLAMDVMSKRLGRDLQLRFDLIGVMSVLGDDTDRLLNATRTGAATDVRLRVAAKHEDSTQIDRMLRELTALWTGGPAGGGGVRVAKRQRLSQKSCLVPRERVPASHAFV